MADFAWTKAKAEAAVLVAEDELSNEAIAERVGISRQGLDKWKAHPDFQARVHEHVAETERSMLRYTIAKKRNRIRAYNEDFQRTERIIAERAEDPSMQNVPGGGTGMMVRQLKSIGFGENNQTVEEFVTDVGLMRERRALLQQAAQELGQWTEKREDKLDATDAFVQALREFGRDGGGSGS